VDKEGEVWRGGGERGEGKKGIRGWEQGLLFMDGDLGYRERREDPGRRSFRMGGEEDIEWRWGKENKNSVQGGGERVWVSQEGEMRLLIKARANPNQGGWLSWGGKRKNLASLVEGRKSLYSQT